jgi:hypothetical protein
MLWYAMALSRTERAQLEVELALAKSSLETLNTLLLTSEIAESRTGLLENIQKTEKVIAEIQRKLAEP